MLIAYKNKKVEVSGYLGRQNIEVAGPVSPADEFTPVLRWNSRVLWHPDYWVGNTVTTESLAGGLTLLLSISLIYKETEE